MSDLKPQTESLESLLSTAIGLLMGHKEHIGYKPNSVIAKFVAECVERLKDWPMTTSTQPAQAVPLLTDEERRKLLDRIGRDTEWLDGETWDQMVIDAVEQAVRSKLGAGAGFKLVPLTPDREVREALEGKSGVDFLLAYADWRRPTTAAPVAQQPQAEAVPPDVTDNWQQYAKGGETAQQCIERHRGEHDSLLTLLSASRAELGRAYRCIQAMHNALTAMQADIPGNGYHSPTIAAAKRFVWEGAIDGTDYFVGKPVAVLHAALALPKTLDAALAAAPKEQP